MTWGLKTYARNAFNGIWDDLTDHINGLRLHSEVHGGLQSISFEIADRYTDSYRWAYDHIGAKIYVFDNVVNPPVAEATIIEPAISQDGTRITAFGPWKASMFNQVYNNTASWIAAGQTGAQIEDMISTECPDISTDLSNVDEPGTNNYPWQPTDNKYAGDMIPELAELSDANNASWYFWLRSAPLAGVTPVNPIAYFKVESAITQVYQCWLRDIVSLELRPSLAELANDVRTLYRDAAGIQNQTPSAQNTDSIARYWLRERWDYDLGLAPRQAALQYRGKLRAIMSRIQQVARFTVNTWAYDQWGGKWPLWRMIADFPTKFCVNDLLPDSTALGFTLDQKRTFITLALDYDYDSNTLTVTPDTADNRADAILARHRALQ